jgi:hypothetical protein
MSEHEELNNLLPLYVSGRLDEARRQSIEAHLPGCAECREDLEFWKATAGEIIREDAQVNLPPDTYEKIAGQIRSRQMKPNLPRRALEILLSQVPLIRREIWGATTAVMIVGAFAAIGIKQAVIVTFLAPLMAAASIAILCGPESDPSIELALSTPTSPRQILLARLVLVFSYDFVLSLAVSLVLVPFLHDLILLPFVMSWLAPMAFLSAFALMLSFIISAENAITIAYLAWLAQFLANGALVSWLTQSGNSLRDAVRIYIEFWKEPAYLLTAAVLMAAISIWLAGRREFHGIQSI